MSFNNRVQSAVEKQLEYHYSDMPHETRLNMCLYGLAEETGEVLGLQKRLLRGYSKDLEKATNRNFKLELGDVLWYLTACCALLGTSLDEIWEMNCEKIQERYGATFDER